MEVQEKTVGSRAEKVGMGLVPIQCVSALLMQPSLPALARALPEIFHPLISGDLFALVIGEGSSQHLMICGNSPDGNDEIPIRPPIPLNVLAKILHSAEFKDCFPSLAQSLENLGVYSVCISALVANGQMLGALLVGRAAPDGFSGCDYLVLASLATPLSVVIDRINAVQADHARAHQLEKERLKLLLINQVTSAVISEIDLRKLVYKVSETIKDILCIEYADLLLYDEKKHVMLREAVGFNGRGLIKEAFEEPICDSPPHLAFLRREIVTGRVAAWAEKAKNVPALQLLLDEGLRDGCAVPLIAHGRALGVLNALSAEEGRFTPECVSLLAEIAKPIAIAVDNALAYKEITMLKDKLTREKEYLEGEVRANYRFDKIVGESEALRLVLDEIETVAESDANVLILGETGTGKELVARALHETSRRKPQPFIKLNCAAIPGDLLESELFGHEKGAFTGAIAAKIGLMELADGGTLFLDEVGDIPLHLQPKLLSVIEERRLIRLGGTRTSTVDFRLISATNRDLAQMITENQFRADLFYRLRVFPITIPPLRERRDDIPLLVRHFTRKFARLRRQDIEFIPTATMEALQRWDWPGNIRELENLIERAVILSKGTTLVVPLKELSSIKEPACGQMLQSAKPTSDEITAEMILRTLRETNGIVAGPRGAAARLGLKRTTLLYKMHVLGISTKQPLR
jgi:formate hydrogenlyase transcriptional activator